MQRFKEVGGGGERSRAGEAVDVSETDTVQGGGKSEGELRGGEEVGGSVRGF